MNYLGHLFLSGTTDEVIVGNFMADGVKGRDLSRFPEQVQHGIRLHRAIDSFTDQHPLHRHGRDRVRAHAGRYAGVVMDLFYDHVLAAHWEQWHEEPLTVFTQRMYALLAAHDQHMPAEIRRLLAHMRAGDWLTGYASITHVGRALHGLSRRARRGERMAGAEVVLAEHLDAYRAEFGVFLSAISAHTAAWRAGTAGGAPAVPLAGGQ
jgi:acyl carrier protein phosphodiesterase